MKYLPIIFLILLLSTSTFAIDFTVNRITDEHDAILYDGICAIAGGGCTLRAAVEQVYNISGKNRILFDLPANSTITLTTANGGEISIAYGSLEIIGTGANNLIIDGGVGTNRILYIADRAIVIISGVTLTGGNGVGRVANLGGAIYSEAATLNLNRVQVTGNTASSSGGGVYLQNNANGLNQIVESTFSGNSATGGCGAIINNAGGLIIVNSTISGNEAKNNFGGGGICTNNSFELINNTTITNNTSYKGGGISKVGGTLVLGNTIIAGNNISPSGTGPEILLSNGSSVTSLGGNLIGDSSGDAANTGIVIDYQSIDILDQNPLLGILQNNGGTTPTHTLLEGSPAIDKGVNSSAVDYANNNTPLLTDERGMGFSRINDGDGDGMSIVDIGSFEKPTAPTAAPVSIGGRILNAKGRGIFRASVTLTKQDGEIKTVFTNPFGYYNFIKVQAGESYILSIGSKQYTFTPRVVFASNDITDLNFTGN